MTIVEKPWGFELIWAQTDNYVGKLLHIDAQQRLSLQYHEIKEVTVFVTQGILLNYDADGSVQAIPAGQSLHIQPNQVHRFGAGKKYVELIEVSTPYLDDVVRLEDDYKR